MSEPVKDDKPQDGLLTSSLYFFEQTIRRTTEYLSDVNDLVRAGSIEPRLWIGSIESFWSGLAEDFGDSLRIAVGSSAAHEFARVRAKDLAVQVLRVDPLQKSGTVAVDIPESLFAPGTEEVKLEIPGFWRGQNLVLRPRVHFDLPRPFACGDTRHVKVCFFDLPKLSSGLPLVGPLLAWNDADETRRLVGIVVVQRV